MIGVTAVVFTALGYAVGWLASKVHTLHLKVGSLNKELPHYRKLRFKTGLRTLIAVVCVLVILVGLAQGSHH